MGFDIVKLLKNYLYVIAYQAAIFLVPLLTSPYLSRVVGPMGIGMYSYTNSIVALFGLFANLGVAKYGSREIAKCGGDRALRSQVFAELIAVKAACAAVAIGIYLCFVIWFGGECREILTIQMLTLLSYVLDISWFFWGLQQFWITTTVGAIVRFSSVGFVFLLVRTQEDIDRYIFILAISYLAMQLVAWIFLPRYVDFKPFLHSFFNRHWKSVVMLFFPLIAKYAYSSLDRILLGTLSNVEEVGYYENVQSVVYVILSIQIALGDVVMPHMTASYKAEDSTQRNWLFRSAFHLITFLSVGTMFGFIGVADAFIPLFYGEEFSSCAELLKLISPVVALAGCSELLRTAVLLPQYRDREYVVALAAGAALNLIVNLALIPRLHSVGAVIGVIAAELFVLLIEAWFVRSEVKVCTYLIRLLIYCGMGCVIPLICAGVAALGFDRLFAVLLDVALGGTVYTLLAVAYLFLFEKEIFALVSGAVYKLRRKKTFFRKSRDC